ncbi:MAG: transcription-repair coupling factor [Anaerolineae bacterium]|nr:transcription-repair coupling factor [Candidatus Roseilinea sp.]MDW8450777.1 transcription-repair coupling factor [Anaerolineae bacterium]
MSLRGLTEIIAGSPALQALAEDVRLGHAPRSLGLPRAARPFVLAALHRHLQRPIVYVTTSVEASRIATDALSNLADVPPLRFAEPNTAFYDSVPPVRDVIAQRSVVLAALGRATNHSSSIIITSPRALMHPVLPASAFKLNTRVIRRDATINLDAMLEHWVKIGYESEPVVERIGAFSRRGGIVDVWSPAHPLPVRIELFGNVADSIRTFDPGTQRSSESLERVVITPLDMGEIRDWRSEIEGESLISNLQSPNLQSLLDYLDDQALLVVDDEEELRDAWRALEERARRERETLAESGMAVNARAPYITWDEFATARDRVQTLVLGQSEAGALSAHPLARQFAQPPHFAGQITPLLDYLKTQRSEGDRVKTIVVSRQAARLAELWSERHTAIAAQTALDEPPQGALTFIGAALPAGFLFEIENAKLKIEKEDGDDSQFSIFNFQFILLTDAEIYGYVRPEWFLRTRARKAAPEKAFSDWQPGDAVVHEDYGIGIYRGLVRLTVNTGTAAHPVEGEREYLLLEYADGDRLYVPLHQLDRVTRYVGSDDAPPRLDKLGSGQWEREKQKARGAAAELARELLQLYAERELARRPPFSKDTPWQIEMESAFPFIETDDQLQAIREVKADMEKPQPMDRLVVGDVGFGKTEVALRAAFKAVQDGKQVAVLVPTTVLAQQHWNTFTQRLASYPIRIEVLSRFRTPAEKREVLEGLRDGTVDIVIGTHALLGKEVKFKDLGLLIIDEEHRFGVAAKEKLKRMRTEVDVLTLTATPIPRTLYLGLSGVRAISRIETPPAERLPIISFIGPWDDAIVQQAIRRELDREGQVFFVHNRVQTIHLVEQKLRRLVPEANIAVAHGQMNERDLAKVMARFAEGSAAPDRIDVLLCTNIIESGLDIPNANTIIVDHADHFGLAELYQLRGRVGRSTVQAYAYFLHDRQSQMTPEARERLATLREAAGIGAGYSIAMRDLELRGAGELLGAKQSGHIAAIGFDLYMRLLANQVQTLRALRDGAPPPPPEPKAVTIDLPLTVGLPESYIGDATLRVQLYRRAASLTSEEEIRAFEAELEDRFGKLPQAARNLTYQLRLKLLANALGAQSITTDGNRFTIRADAIGRMDLRRVRRAIGDDALIGRTQVSFLRSGTPDQWKQRLMDALRKLAEIKATLPPEPALPASPARETMAAVEAEEAPRLPPMTQDDW